AKVREHVGKPERAASGPGAEFENRPRLQGPDDLHVQSNIKRTFQHRHAAIAVFQNAVLNVCRRRPVKSDMSECERVVGFHAASVKRCASGPEYSPPTGRLSRPDGRSPYVPTIVALGRMNTLYGAERVVGKCW